MEVFTIYILPFVLMMAAELIYFKIADRYNIIDKPNQRSSHAVPVTRGGGIIFLVAMVLFSFYSKGTYPYLLTAMLVSGIVSFADDVKPLPNYIKFSAHIASVLLVLRECSVLSSLPLLYLLVIAIVLIGVINAYNFMDGINGITGLYSLAVIAPLYFTETGENLKLLMLFSLLALLVFNFFNTRKKARCFAGDVGSISLAILIAFLIIMRIRQTDDFLYIGLLMIYGLDAVYTIVQRLFQHENIFQPHRKHLYQYLSNEKKIPQLVVGGTFAFIQAMISFSISYGYLKIQGIAIVFISLSIAYWVLKAPFIRRNSVK